MKKIGFFAIVGRPNVGKSTLLNQILGEKIAIVSSKPQTTRHRILGIETRGENQFVFLDTPGIFQAKNSLGDYMVKTANSAMQDADAVILVADAGFAPGETETRILQSLKRSEIPVILALNKVDLYRREILILTFGGGGKWRTWRIRASFLHLKKMKFGSFNALRDMLYNGV